VSTPLSTLDMEAPQVDLRRSDVLVFEGRLPDPAELLQWGGRPGVQYLIVDAANLNAATMDTSTGQRWVLCKDVPVYQVKGPKGTASILVLSRGTPIQGADPTNGIREWFYDRTLLTTTGLTTPYGGISSAQQVPQASSHDAGGRSQPAVRQEDGNPAARSA
jgi:hypothetical protein